MNNSYNQMNKNPNTNFVNNNLLSGYQNFQKNNLPFQNNPLLNNNPHFVNMVNNQQMQMMNLYNHMAKYKQAQEMKKMQKSSDVNNVFDKDLIHESVIRPIKIVRDDPHELINSYNKRNKDWTDERTIAWKERTNQPYKNVLKNENYDKFIGRQGKIDVNELIVHKVTDEDKIGILEELKDLRHSIEKHNSELKVIYSTSKEMEHKKKFEYIHRDKYRIKYDPKDYEGLRKDQLEYYKKEQQKLEKNKKNVMEVIESLLNKGILDEEDIKNIEKEEKMLDNDDTVSNLENQLKNELGDEYDKLEKEAIKLLEEKKGSKDKNIDEIDRQKKSSKDKNMDEIDNRQKKKITIKTKQKENETEISVHKKINTNIDDLKQKYLNRQKK